MVKLAGSLLVLLGGGMAWGLQRRERKRQRDTLAELLWALRQMGESIRMARTPLPRLLASLAPRCGPEVSALLLAAAEAAGRGEDLAEVWRRMTETLPLSPRDLETLQNLDFRGDEAHLSQELAIAAHRLEDSVEEWERRRPEEDKRAAALCFSAAALLVILLI